MLNATPQYLDGEPLALGDASRIRVVPEEPQEEHTEEEHLEKEFKYPTTMEEVRGLIRLLKTLGFTVGEVVFQTDTFVPSGKRGTHCRVREEIAVTGRERYWFTTKVNQKGKRYAGLHREHEKRESAQETAARIRAATTKLGCKPPTVTKNRTPYSGMFEKMLLVICIDHAKTEGTDLGWFVELEAKLKDLTEVEAAGRILAALAELLFPDGRLPLDKGYRQMALDAAGNGIRKKLRKKDDAPPPGSNGQAEGAKEKKKKS
jgi:adenylate cyclase class IV